MVNVKFYSILILVKEVKHLIYIFVSNQVGNPNNIFAAFLFFWCHSEDIIVSLLKPPIVLKII